MKSEIKGRFAQRAGSGTGSQYVGPLERSKALFDAIVSESVNTKYTGADNARFMLDLFGRVCAAFSELRMRSPQLRDLMADEDESPNAPRSATPGGGQ